MFIWDPGFFFTLNVPRDPIFVIQSEAYVYHHYLISIFHAFLSNKGKNAKKNLSFPLLKIGSAAVLKQGADKQWKDTMRKHEILSSFS